MYGNIGESEVVCAKSGVGLLQEVNLSCKLGSLTRLIGFGLSYDSSQNTCDIRIKDDHFFVELDKSCSTFNRDNNTLIQTNFSRSLTSRFEQKCVENSNC